MWQWVVDQTNDGVALEQGAGRTNTELRDPHWLAWQSNEMRQRCRRCKESRRGRPARSQGDLTPVPNFPPPWAVRRWDREHTTAVDGPERQANFPSNKVNRNQTCVLGSVTAPYWRDVGLTRQRWREQPLDWKSGPAHCLVESVLGHAGLREPKHQWHQHSREAQVQKAIAHQVVKPTPNFRKRARVREQRERTRSS